MTVSSSGSNNNLPRRSVADKQRLITQCMRGIVRDWVFIPLRANSKIPAEKKWEQRTSTTEAEIRRWVTDGLNVGLSCGASGLVVVDIDHGADVSMHDLPDTVEVITPHAGRHLYYLAPEDVVIGNSVSNIVQYVDIRGAKGQVVFPGSTLDGKRYLFEIGNELGAVDIAPLPQWIIDLSVKEKVAVAPLPVGVPVPATPGRFTAWANSAIGGLVTDLQAATEGTRNNTLNKVCFKAGQVVEAGGLDVERLELQFYTIAVGIGLKDSEARATVRSGLKAGQEKPRYPKDHDELPIVLVHGEDTPAQAGELTTDLLVPGLHIDKEEAIHRVTYESLAREILSAAPHGTFVRRMGDVGWITPQGLFTPYTATSVIISIDRICHLWEWIKKKNGARARVSRVCNRTHGQGVLDALMMSDVPTPELDLVTAYPVLTQSMTISPPGLHGGIFVAGGSVDLVEDKEEALGLLDEAIQDFPFKAPSDKDNFLALLFTPLVRPLLDLCPLFVISAAQARTGKTLLAQGVLGGILHRESLPTTAWPGQEDELRKVLTSLNQEGSAVVLFDNLPTGLIESARLAEASTSERLKDRVLGATAMTSAPNRFTIITTGNNIRFSSELAKRTIPIRLAVEDGMPEERAGFKHEMLRTWVREHRDRLLGSALGLIQGWVADGAPKATGPRLAGFERWVSVVGGLVAWCGREGLGRNRGEWLADHDEEGDQVAQFMHTWTASLVGDASPRDLVAFAAEIWPDVADARDERAASIRVGKRLRGLVGAKIRMADGRILSVRKRKLKGCWIYRGIVLSPRGDS